MLIGRIFEVLYWTWVGSETILQIGMRTWRSKGEVKDRGSLLILLPAIFFSIWAAFWWGETHPHTMLNDAPWLRTLAVVLLAAGLAIRWTAIISLGRSFSTNVAIRSGQNLYRGGLYRWLRHPSYTGMLFCFAAIGVWERNWISLALSIVPPVAALLYRIRVEEAALNSAFGDDYAQYSRETRRILPGIY